MIWVKIVISFVSDFVKMAQSLFKVSNSLTSTQVGRLSSEELDYELAIKGLSPGNTIDDKRKSLRAIFRLEKMGHSIERIAYPFKFAEDSTAVQKGIAEIKTLYNEWSGNSQDAVVSKLSAKLCHVLGRINRAVVEIENNSQSKLKNSLLVQITELIEDCKHKCNAVQRTSTPIKTNVPVCLSQISHNVSDSEISESDSDEDIAAHSHHEATNAKSSFVPVYKWTVRFKGRRGESINAFLRDVEEHCRSRNVNKRQLLQSAGDLFTETAKVWYRANYKKFESWDALVIALKEEFLVPHYDNDLYDQIKKRTQGPSETIGMYFANMSTLFDDLTMRVPEDIKVAIVRSNLMPLYQNQLALNDPKSLEELKSLCKRLEQSRHAVENYHPPRANRNALEPELAVINEVRCFQCGQIGHFQRNCRLQRKDNKEIKCFGCGKLGVKKFNCSQCQGNVKRR